MTNKKQRRKMLKEMASNGENYADGVKIFVRRGVNSYESSNGTTTLFAPEGHNVSPKYKCVRHDPAKVELHIGSKKGLNLANCYLKEAKFGGNYDHAVFKGSYLPKMDFWHSTFENSNFRNAILEKSSFQNGHFKKCDFRGADLESINGYYADMEGSDLRGVNLNGASFQNANLRGIRAENTDFRGVSSFLECNLEGARLIGADLRNQYFGAANLKNADLRNADLRGVSWMDKEGYYITANTEGTLLNGAIIDDGKGNDYVLI